MQPLPPPDPSTKVFDLEEPADVRAFIRGTFVGGVFLVNAFADRIGYDPLSGTESTAIIGLSGLAVYAVRKWRARRQKL